MAGEDARGPYGPYRQMKRLPLYADGGRAPPWRPIWPTPATARPRSSTPSGSGSRRLKLPPRYSGRCARLTADRAGRVRGRGPRARAPLPGRRGRRRVRRHRPRPGRDRRREPRRRLRHRPGRRDAALQLHGRGRRRRDADQPRHPGRGPPEQHAQAGPDLSGRSASPCREFAHLPLILNPDRTKMSKRKSQTAVGDYIAEGFVREGLVNYLALLGWATGTEEEVLGLDELVRPVRARGGPQGRRRVRPRAARVAQRPVDPAALRRRARRPARPVPRRRGGRRPDRSACRPTTRSARSSRSSRSACPSSARSATSSGSCSSIELEVDPALLVPKRWDAADDTRRAGRRAGRDRRRPRRWSFEADELEPTAPRGWPRSGAGRPATCSWRSGWRSPGGRRRRPCSTRSSRSVASGRWPGWTRRSPRSGGPGQRTRRRTRVSLVGPARRRAGAPTPLTAC